MSVDSKFQIVTAKPERRLCVVVYRLSLTKKKRCGVVACSILISNGATLTIRDFQPQVLSGYRGSEPVMKHVPIMKQRA